MEKPELYLHEEIMLLSLRDQEGTIEPMVSYREAIAGALLAELLLQQYIEIDGSKRGRPIRQLKAGPTGDALLDECLDKIKASRIRKNLKNWVMNFRGLQKLKHRIAGELCRKGILEESEDKVMLLFSRRIYPEINVEPEHKIIERLRDAIFSDNQDIDTRTIILVSLAHHTRLLKRIFDRNNLKQKKDRIKQLSNGEVVGKATKEAIEAMQAALLTAVIVPSVAAGSGAR